MAPPCDGGDEQRYKALLDRFKQWLAKDPRHKHLYSEFQQTTQSAGARALPVEDALLYIVKMHAENAERTAETISRGSNNEFKAFANACQRTLQLMCSVQALCNTTLEICRWFAPKRLRVNINTESLVFELHDMDDEGRAIYAARGKSLPPDKKYLRWHKPEDGYGRWALKTDEKGVSRGEYQLDGALATDAGAWVRPGSSERGDVSVAPRGELAVDAEMVRELRDIAVTSRVREPAGCAEAVGGACEPPSVEEAAHEICQLVAEMNLDKEVLANLHEVLSTLCDIAAMLEWKIPGWQSAQEAYDVKPKGKTLPDLFQSLVSLSGMEGDDLLRQLRKQLPRYDEKHAKKCLVSQCMILNCRLLGLSDLHSVKESFLPRLVHRMSLWSWQRRLPREAREERVVVEAEQEGESVRFVAVSDTHGWAADIQLPDGDVLLHCGDILFEAGHVHQGDELPTDVLAVANLFKTDQYRKYKWIFVVCGNHDQPIYDLWRREPERLFELLPDNLVMLQAHTNFGDNGRLDGNGGAAKLQAVRDCVQNGAIRLTPMQENGKIRLKVGKPEDKAAGGWVIAGTGVSLVTNPWSSNRAFQLPKPCGSNQAEQTEILKEAARSLLRHEPDIVMTYGPPQPTEHGSKERADGVLLAELKECKSWKVTLFGHIQEDHGRVGELGGRPLVCAALCTPLFVPARPPVVFALGAKLSALPEVPVSDDLLVPLLSKARSGSLPDEGCLARLLAPLTRYSRRLLFLDRGDEDSALEDDEDLVAGWLPRDYVESEVLQLLDKRREKAAEDRVAEAQRMDGSLDDARKETLKREARAGVQLSEFTVAGPAVMYAFRSVCLWGFNVLLSLVAFQVTDDPVYYFGGEPCEGKKQVSTNICKAFVDYPFWLWGGWVLIFIWTWKVQTKCLGYILVPHAQLLARAGYKRMRFRFWWWQMFFMTGLASVDVSSQCLFFAQFSRSILSNPAIPRLWEKVAKQSLMKSIPGYTKINVLFSVCWSMMFLQALHLILSSFGDEDKGVCYDFESMPQGYSTMSSSLLAVSVDSVPVGDDLHKSKQTQGRSCFQRCWGCSPCWGWRPLNKKYSKNWHADVLRTVARYGRMPALLDHDKERLEARLRQELRKGQSVRYLQILFSRMKDDIFALLLVDILETAFKLEMQVSIFSMELALEPLAKTALHSRTILQMHLAIFFSCFSVMYSFRKHIKAYLSYKSMSFSPDASDFLNRDECNRNWSHIKCTLRWYLIFIVVFSLFIAHSIAKLVYAYRCPSSVWNFWNGCADIGGGYATS